MNKLNFIWHMHQPFYIKDDVITMPWVFLHLIKDYYDMPYLVEKCGIKATFNLTPSLIEQIQMYEKSFYKDKFLSLWIKHPSQLNEEEKKFILDIIKSIPINLVINERLKILLDFEILADIEFIEMEILYILSWCGNYLQDKLKDFNNFTQKAKEELFDILSEFIKGVLPYYKKLQNKGIISIWTTPYTHPILPLLIDMNNARYANENTILPKNHFSLKDDAIKHIKKAIEIYEDVFETSPIGFWPAEGAVDEESIKLYRENNIKYIATDESLLDSKYQNDSAYKKDNVVIFFRNHNLSDKIGFKYRYYDIESAINDFKIAIPNYPINSIILDGENAWEYYNNKGYVFLENLYLSLKKEYEFILANEIDEYKNLDYIKTGSWINGNFNTWVGNKYQNTAWQYLFDAKKLYLSKEKNEKIEELFLYLESSDFYWWFSDYHNTTFIDKFDSLFREYLTKIYTLMNEKIPAYLNESIYEKQHFLIMPTSMISPIIDGKITYKFEWYGAGILNLVNSTMAQNGITKVLFGEDEEYFYFAFIGNNIKNIEVFLNHKKIDFVMKQDDIIELKIKKTINENNFKFILDNQEINLSLNNKRWFV